MLRSSLSVNNKSYFSTNPQCIPAGGFVEVDAFSKINLFLEVVSRRPDGYHELVMVMQRLQLCDKLQFRKCGEGLPVKLEVNGCANLPTDGRNLIVKAAELIMKKYNITQPIQIKLDKQIPIGAGLGGGSSDCAATLIGLAKIFELDITFEELMEMGKSLGADVPFCIFANLQGGSGTAIAKGIGEVLTPLEPHPDCCVVLACPGVHVSTKEIFNRITDLSGICLADDFIAGYNTGDTHVIAKNFYNRFTQITSELHPQISALIADLQNQDAHGTSMTGTGATVFAYFSNENKARVACDILQQKHKTVKFFVTKVK